jgi:hypothetical protein
LLIVHRLFHQSLVQHLFYTVLEFPVIEVKDGVDLIDLIGLPFKLGVCFFQLSIFLIEFNCTLLNFPLQLFIDLVLQEHVYLMLMYRSFQCPVSHVFENANAIS